MLIDFLADPGINLTFGIMKALDAVMGVRVSDEAGLDQSEHAETAYNLLDFGFGRH